MEVAVKAPAPAVNRQREQKAMGVYRVNPFEGGRHREREYRAQATGTTAMPTCQEKKTIVVGAIKRSAITAPTDCSIADVLVIPFSNTCLCKPIRPPEYNESGQRRLIASPAILIACSPSDGFIFSKCSQWLAIAGASRTMPTQITAPNNQ
jgi:hypothetical protein